jgi:hypothetical protein
VITEASARICLLLLGLLPAVLVADTISEPIPAANCWAVTSVEVKGSVLEIVEPWSVEANLIQHPMLDGATAFLSEPLGLMLIVHPFPSEDLIKISAYSKDGARDSLDAFRVLADQLFASEQLSGLIVPCAEIGETGGVAYF